MDLQDESRILSTICYHFAGILIDNSAVAQSYLPYLLPLLTTGVYIPYQYCHVQIFSDVSLNNLIPYILNLQGDYLTSLSS